MAAPTVAGVAAQVDVLQGRIAELETRIAALDGRVAGLTESDQASGWAKWRENQNRGGT